MPQYMLISHDSTEIPEGVEFTPEMIQSVLQHYYTWIEKLQKSGHMVSLNKLKDNDFGRNLKGIGKDQVVTDGPYAETKEIIGGYWVIKAKNYDEAVKLASDCPSLVYGSRVEIREVDELPN